VVDVAARALRDQIAASVLFLLSKFGKLEAMHEGLTDALVRAKGSLNAAHG
jgi:hypothetical protein